MDCLRVQLPRGEKKGSVATVHVPQCRRPRKIKAAVGGYPNFSLPGLHYHALYYYHAIASCTLLLPYYQLYYTSTTDSVPHRPKDVIIR